MKLSPVQLIESKFVKISVELRDFESEADDSSTDSELDVEHMMHIEKHEVNSSSDQESTGHRYLLALGLRSGKDELKSMPYDFEVVVTGIIVIEPGRFDNVDDTAARYGFTMLYGQIREIVTNLTGRMNNGQFLLPTMSFMDATYSQSQTSD